MAKGVGLDAGEYEIKVVELDGSYKKPRLAKVSVDRVSQPSSLSADDPEHAAREAESALQALKGANIARDNVILGFPCREAVLRTLDVPFKGEDQIRKVIKFEVEDSIHSHSVDDMVVDFHTLEEMETETRVMVAAVPKHPLRVTLDELEALGIDPEIVDLDTMALYRVAEWAGCFDTAGGDAEGDDDAGETLPATKDGRARIVMDVGGRSTRVLAVIDGQIVDMRALRVGVDGIADEVAAAKGVSLPAAREAVFSVFESGQSYEFKTGDSADPDGEDGEERESGGLVAASSGNAVSTTEISSAATELLRRIHRELMRFVASMQSIEGIDAVYVTGGGAFLPGLDEVIGDVFGCKPQPLAILDKLTHNLDPDEVDWIEPRIAVAIGLALGPMGGIQSMQFRREELAFQRGFDRIKFPLAIACMFAVFLLAIVGLRQMYRVDALAEEYGKTYQIKRTEGSGRAKGSLKAEFHGYTALLINEKAGKYSAFEYLDRKQYRQLLEKVAEADTFDRLRVVHKYMQKLVKDQREETGIYEDLQLPSGFEALARFCQVIANVEQELGSFVVMTLDLAANRKLRTLSFKIAVRGEGYRGRLAKLTSALEAEFEDPGSPFGEFAPAGRGEDPYQGEVLGVIKEFKIVLKEVRR